MSEQHPLTGDNGSRNGARMRTIDALEGLTNTAPYTGARVQRFIFKGVGPVTKAEQGVAWPQNR